MAIARRAAVGGTFNAVSGSVTIPSAIAIGDGMVAAVTWNSGTAATATTPGGWTQQGTDLVMGTRTTRILKRQAQSGDAGSAFTVTLSASAKCAIVLGAWQNLNVSIIDVMQTFNDASSGTTHSAASANTSQSNEWGLVIWTEKSSTNNSWTPPAGLTTVVTAIGAGSGASSTLMADTNGVIP